MTYKMINMKNSLLTVSLLLLFSGIATAQSKSDWRPENRTGVSAETGLMKSWPAGGPTLIWSNLELGKGFSSPSFGNNTIYITGNKGDIGAEDILYALDINGKILWQTAVGRAWTGANLEKFELVSSFKVNLGNTGPFWAHPVINNGVLYLRHTNALMAYNIKTK
jgi:hypothetical protein